MTKSAEAPDLEGSVDAPRIRLDALTGLRWLAAFWVFGYHMPRSTFSVRRFARIRPSHIVALAAAIHHRVEHPAERAIPCWKDRRDRAAQDRAAQA